MKSSFRKKRKENFWHNLPRPFFALAPMLDVTDIAFRAMFVKYSKKAKKSNGPHVLFTEFVSADGLCSDEGREHILPMLEYMEDERPIVAQIFSANPENMNRAASLCAELGFDGIDVNMGCPERNIIKQGAGAALIKDHKLAQEIVNATIAGANGLPVSVKTRTGFLRAEILDWMPALLETDISAITLHARTQKQMSKVDAEWDHVGEMVDIIKSSGKKVLGIGNGDVKNIGEAQEKAQKYNCDGVMIARGAYGNPWFFNNEEKDISVKEKISALIEHIELFEKLCKHKNFSVMKKHFKAYISGFSGAKELRMELMKADYFLSVVKILKEQAVS